MSPLALRNSLQALVLLATVLGSAPPAQGQRGAEGGLPWRSLYQLEHPQHRLAHWYASESLHQFRQESNLLSMKRIEGRRGSRSPRRPTSATWCGTSPP